MITFEIVPFQGDILYLVDYVDLTFESRPVTPLELEIVARAFSSLPVKGKRKTFETLSDAKTFIDTYLEHFALYMTKCSEPENGWIWKT